MNRCLRLLAPLAYGGVLLALSAGAAWAGPPYQTDDPEPVAYRHYEMYFGTETDNGPDGSRTSMPFAEINFGPLPNVQIAASLPLQLATVPGLPARYGIGNLDLGIKYRFVPESSSRPQVSFYPSIEVPTGAASLDPLHRAPTIFLPLWAQITSGHSTFFGGGGWERNTGGVNRDFWSGGIADVRQISPRINAGFELYGNTAEAIGERGTTSAGIGMNDDYSPMHSVLLSVGTSIAGERDFHAYAAYEVRLGPEGEALAP